MVTKLDGKTLSNNKWSGEIGNTLDAATEFKINLLFVRISFPESLIPVSGTVVKDLSADQAYGCRITQVIRTSVLSTDLASGIIRNQSCKPLLMIKNCK